MPKGIWKKISHPSDYSAFVTANFLTIPKGIWKNTKTSHPSDYGAFITANL